MTSPETTLMRAFTGFLRGSRRWLLASLATAVLQSGVLVAIGLLIRRAFDHEIPDGDVGTLAVIGAALLGLALVAAALAVWTRYLVLGAVKGAVARLRIALLERLNALPAAWFDRADAETVHTTVVQDTERVDIVANAVAAQLAPAVVIGTGLAVALLVINPLLLAILAAVLPVLAVLTRRFDGVVRRRTRTWQLAFDRFAARVHFAVRARPLITAQVAEEGEVDAGRREAIELSDAGQRMAWLHGVYAQLHGAVATAAGVVVLVVGGAAVARGRMSLGSLISFYTLLAILRAQGSAVLATVPQAASGRESLARLQAILSAPDRDPYSGTRRAAIRRSVALRDVHFGYREGEPVLGGVTLGIERGEQVALVGANGAGKTTVAALILGLYRPWRGVVEADGISCDELDVRSLRRRIGLVAQRPILFSRSIADNIAYGAETSHAGRVREAARLATADDFVGRLEHGYETLVGDDGDPLSGGERQRIAIARALVREPALLILDEPTSSLGRHAVARVLANLRALAHRPAVLVISHDPAVIDDADRVVYLQDGCVREPLPAGRRAHDRVRTPAFERFHPSESETPADKGACGMRIESSVTSISWIPSEAIEGMPKLPFEIGIGHYDPPPPDHLGEGDLEWLRDQDGFREANELKAWIDVEDGKIVDQGYSGGGLVGFTTFSLGIKKLVVPGVAFDVLRAEPEVRDDAARFVQTVGGRAGFPQPRRVSGKPFLRIQSATAWTTLALTIRADGTSEHEVEGASPFPRHWIYDRYGVLVQKSGTVDFKSWYREAHGDNTPWGNEDSPAFVTQAETALERQISRWLMREGQAPERRTLEPGQTLVEQGAEGTDLYLLLDGVLGVEVDGEEVAEIGPGAVLGERAVLGGGKRTATLTAQTRCRVAVVAAELIDRGSLERLSASRDDR